MNWRDIISSGLIESYVLGITNTEENELIRRLCDEHPELIKEIEAVEESLIHLSAQTSRPLNPSLKEKISAGLQFNEDRVPSSPERIIPLPQQGGDSLKLYKFAMAASLLLFVTSFVYNVLLQKQLNRANGELAQLNDSRSVMAEQMKIQEVALSSLTQQFHIVSDPKVKTVGLNGMNYLAKNSAAVHWNTETDEVYFDALQLAASPTDKQYQLWAIVAGKPVDMGMIDVTAGAEIFQKMKSVKGAQAFAVTIEKVGGSPTPSLETMCLLGNV